MYMWLKANTGLPVGKSTNTVTVNEPSTGRQVPIDTGFMVYNEVTYPNLTRLFAEIGAPTTETNMSFSVQHRPTGLEWCGSGLDGLFAQRSNLLRPSFHRMIRDILRFNRMAPRVLASKEEFLLGEYLAREGYSRTFIDNYLLPMGAAIWSTDPARMMSFPARFFVRFFHNHGMLSVDQRPQWRAIRGGSARYVDKLIAPFKHRIRVNTPVERVWRMPDRVMIKVRDAEAERFDYAFLACHSDQALRMLADPSTQEREVIGAIPYHPNEAVLHTDTSLLPRKKLAWAAWNYHVLPQAGTRVALTYNMNILQSLTSRHTFCVTLNRSEAIAPERVIKRLSYDHPLFTPAAVAAQQRQHEINGANLSYFCGAYWRFGFHEDGVVSALNALQHFERNLHAQRDLSRVA